jgi:hypothetical protein
MQNPFGVATLLDDSRWSITAENRWDALWIEEGRTRPGHAMSHHAHHFYSWTRPETAKPASSQGEALAKNEIEETPPKTSLKDMILEFTHD